MTSSVLKFGDIFNYHEKDYVFLVKTEDSIYAAQILPLDLSIQIQQKHNKVLRDTLEGCDLNAIREEILDDYSMVPRELKKLIKDMYFKKNK